MDFYDAMDIFLAFSERYDSRKLYLKDKTLNSQLVDLNLHENYGIRVYILTHSKGRLIVLCSDDVDITPFLKQISISDDTAPLVEKLVNCMDTEWDKRILRVLIGMTHAYSQMIELGLDPHKIVADRKRVMDYTE